MSLPLLLNQNVASRAAVSAIDSANGRGIERRLAADPKSIASITTQIKPLEEILAGANLAKEQRVQAAAFELLVHAPQPESKAINSAMIATLLSPLAPKPVLGPR